MYGNKVYHINIIVEFKLNETITYHKARIILNKSGIKRIELPKHDVKISSRNKILNTKYWNKFKKSGMLKS